MSEAEILSSIEEYSEDGIFYLWANQLVRDALSEWHEFMGRECFPCIMEFEDDVIGINYDAYWLFECRDKDELDCLLKSWYKGMLTA